MELRTKFGLIIFAAVLPSALCTAENHSKTLGDKRFHRSARTNDEYFGYSNFDTFQATGVKPENFDSGLIKSKIDGGNADYNGYFPYAKGYLPDAYSHKSFPYFKDNGDDMTEEQMLEMMAMMMSKPQDIKKKKDESFLSKILSDPVSLAAAFPMTILLASFIPVLLSYFMPGLVMPSSISTIASSKMARSLTEKEFLRAVLEDLMEFSARALIEDECLQKSICEMALRHGGVKNMKQVASAVSDYGRKEWLKLLRANHLVKALKHGDCSKVCHNVTKTRKSLNF